MDDPLRRPALVRKLVTARALPAADLALVAICWLMLGVASLMIVALPSRRLLRALGAPGDGAAPTPASDARQRERARRIGRAIAIAAKNAPFRADCYPQALTAAQLCRWCAIPHAVRLGVRFAALDSGRAGKLEGHAWVCSGALTVCGGAGSARQFGTVACFVHQPRKAGGDATD